MYSEGSTTKARLKLEEKVLLVPYPMRMAMLPMGN